MTKRKTIRILKKYNAWRRGADTPMIHPQLIGEAIESAIRKLVSKKPILSIDR